MTGFLSGGRCALLQSQHEVVGDEGGESARGARGARVHDGLRRPRPRGRPPASLAASDEIPSNCRPGRSIGSLARRVRRRGRRARGGRWPRDASRIDGAPMPAVEEMTLNLRAAGNPQVWPQAWSIAGRALDEEEVVKRLKAWSTQWTTVGVRRCGVARGTAPDEASVIAAVAVDALANLAPLPVTARVGQRSDD